MRKLREGMMDDLSFRNVYWSSNGSAIIEVTHESSKEPDDRVHPVSYMAFIGLNDGRTLHESTKVLSYLWRGEPMNAALGEVPLRSFEPLSGFYHDTYWSAKAAVEMDEDPSRILDTFEKVAREERTSKGHANWQRLGARHYDKLEAAILAERDAGNLPSNLRTAVEELGGGMQGLALYYLKDLANPKIWENTEDFRWLITDTDGPLMLGFEKWNEDGEEVYADEGDNIIDFPYDSERFTKPDTNKNPSFWVNPDPLAYFDKEDWDLENPKAIEQIVQALVNIERFAKASVSMRANL